MSTPPPITADEFRHALGQFPTGVAIVTARYDGRLVGITANSFSSVSLEPPLILWSVAKASASHETFTAAEAFAVHFLGAEQHDLALRFAGPGDRFDGLGHAEGVTGAPLIEGLAPILECRAWARYEGGDHTILVGEVVRLVARVQEPLLFHSGVMRRIDGPPPRHRGGAILADGVGANDLVHALARASQLISSGLHASLASLRVTVAEWRVLACLVEAGGLDVGELAGMAAVAQPGLAEILDRLKQDRHVECLPDPADREHELIHLTQAGRARVAPMLIAAREHEARLLGRFSEEERALIRQALDLLTDEPGAATVPPS